MQSIRRVAVGSLSLAAIAIPNLQLSACITAQYSQRLEGRVPLITFTAPHMPISMALARSLVLNMFYKSVTDIFGDSTVDPRVRHGIAAAMKVVAIQHTQEANLELSERCGD
jgi:acyl-CoA oxidase